MNDDDPDYSPSKKPKTPTKNRAKKGTPRSTKPGGEAVVDDVENPTVGDVIVDVVEPGTPEFAATSKEGAGSHFVKDKTPIPSTQDTSVTEVENAQGDKTEGLEINDDEQDDGGVLGGTDGGSAEEVVAIDGPDARPAI